MKSQGVEENAGREPVAVIGIGCRFPGARGPDAFWELLRNGVDAIREIPPDRPGLSSLHDPRPGSSGRLVNRLGGFLEEVDGFDAAFFGISPREAERMDPQQRLLLEVAWEALEDAGQVADRLAGSASGVFVGLWINDYEALLFADPARVDFYMTTGSGRYSASGRLSYAFGLQGPSVTVDTACSSSLVAVHLACQALRSGECGLALAGGANTILTPQVSVAYAQSQMLSPDGRCKFGDARADGYVRSEGAGVVALKLLSRALAEGDPVHAVILGSAVNNDGKTSGFLATPGRGGQEDLLGKAYRAAGVDPRHVDYVEAHGTGTTAGDPVELQALGRVLAEGRTPDRPCLVGSVKTNVGHTEGAAGVAGLIKVVLSLGHRTIPASLHFQEPNPSVPWSELPLAIPREAMPWPEGPGAALAGVSAFGITGTNAHVVVREAPPAPEAVAEAGARRPRLLPLSARSPEALKDLAAAYRDRLRSAAPAFSDLCYTASIRRTHHEHRLALVARSAEEAVERLEAFLRGEPAPGTATSRAAPAGAPKVVFVFPGQGSQWLGMARQVLESEPAFRASLEACDHAVRGESGFSVLEELACDPERSRLGEIDVIQPTLFSIQVALAALWRSWGIEPAAVVGHSMGEVAAAQVAGVLSLPDAARVICRRSRLLRRTRGRGAMAVVELSFRQAREAIAGHEDRLSVAVSNSSRSTVLSGDPGALDGLIAALEKRDVFCRRVKVDVASHSPQMDALRDDLLAALESVCPGRGQVPLYSTVTGEVEDGTQMGAAYWARNLREPVMFSSAVGRLLTDGHSAFLELSAHPILLPAIQQELQHLGHEGAVLPSLRREEDELGTLLESLGALHALGCAVDWKALYPAGGRCLRLPSYPWQHERFWYEGAGSGRGRGTAVRRGAHPLLGPHLGSSMDAGAHFWETELGVGVVPWLEDHRVNGLRIMPASAYVEMALAAAAEAFGGPPAVLSDFSTERALAVPDEPPVTVQVMLSAEMPGAASFRISSLEAGEAGRAARWTVHAKGAIRFGPTPSDEGPIPEAFPSGRAGAPGQAHYRAMASRGLHYGPSFQGVQEVWSAGGEAWGRLVVPEGVRGEASAYRLHPALLDAGFQLLVAAASGAEVGAAEDETLVPSGLEHLQLWKLPQWDKALRGHARLRPGLAKAGDAVVGDVILLDDEGRKVLEVRGLRLQRLERRRQDLDDCFFTFEWEANGREASLAARPGPGRWLVFGGASPAAGSLASLLAERGDAVVIVSPGEAYGSPEAGRYRVDPERPEDFRRLLAETQAQGGGPWRGVVHMWSLDAPDPRDRGLAALRSTQRLGCASALHLVQALAAGDAKAPRLWLVTAGTQRVGRADEVPGLGQAPLWGLGRVAAREHPELRSTAIDLSPAAGDAELRSLRDELVQDGPEDQVALRGEGRYVARLVRRSPEEAAAAQTGKGDGRQEPAAGRPFRAVIARPGVVDNLRLRGTERRAPGSGQVEIEVHATGLNFMNVMSALGIYPGDEGGSGPLGLECSGRICAVGEAVDEVKVGDEVLAVAFDSLASHTLADVRLVVPKPSHLGFEEGATVPIAFLTAHYALRHLARLQAGERVLIHAAAGGVGQAALQIARRVGAEVYATAGSPEKREFLRSLGVRHVMDSRSLAFADEVRGATGGEGVDLVLNSLAGEAIPRSLDVLRPFGRFVEIGKRDIHRSAPLSLAPFQKGLSYFAVDLDRMIRERPALVGGLLREVMTQVEESALSPLPLRTFPVGEVAEAFRYMAQARHTGKIVLRVQGEDPAIEVEARPAAPLSEGTYLITGGLGGLGLQMARWLANRGVRHLALMSRSGLTDAARNGVEGLRRAGAQVRVIRGDVADEAQVARALAEVDEAMPRLRGVIHAAGIVDDARMLQLDRPRLDAVMAPKVAGAWNLHALTAGRPLDLFVLFSSVASLLGSPGQAGDAAGNAFLDALAAHRAARGLPALAIDWGPWSDVGLAAARVRTAGGSNTPAAARAGSIAVTAAKPLHELTYAVAWPRREREARSDRGSQGPGSWLILADRSGVGVALARLLRERGEHCVTFFADAATSAERLSRMLHEGWKPNGAPRRGVVHLWSLDAPPADETTAASLEAAHDLGCVSVMHVVRALADAGGPRLWLVTRGAQPVTGPPSPVAVAQAPVWGFGRVVALEHPECWGGLVDLDPGAPADEVRRLVEEITHADGEDQVAFRGEERRVPRLVREPLKIEAPAPLSEGAYMVTGGLGGLGLQVARWLVERGARHLVLTSRTGLPERPRWDEFAGNDGGPPRVEAVRRLEALGASVTVVAADVNDRAAMAPVFGAFGRALPRLRGVVHAAGVMTASPLIELRAPALLDVLRPKVTGAWVLHDLTDGLELDFFVLFSSSAALWGSKGLGHYGAANHFLDALAHHRRGRGLPALSVNWGWCSGGGMTSGATEAFFRRVGLAAMSPAQTLGALGRLLADGSVQKTVADVDWDVFKAIYEAWGPRPFLREVDPATRSRPSPGDDLDGGDGEADAAGAAHEARFAGRGLTSLTPAGGLLALERVLREQPVRVAVVPFDLGQWCATHPTAASSPLLTHLRVERGTGKDADGVGMAARSNLRDALLAIEPGRRRHALLESHLKERMAQVLRLAPARIDVNKPLRSLGLDSLMALELRNRLEADLGLKLSATLVWNHPTVNALVPHLADHMGIPLEAPEPEAALKASAEDGDGIGLVLDEIERLPAEEARRLLADGNASEMRRVLDG